MYMYIWYIHIPLFSRGNMYSICIYGASGKEKGGDGKSKGEGALEIKREGEFDTRGWGEPSFA